MLFSRDDDRYVLIQTLPDGTPQAVQPVSNFLEGERILKSLTQHGEANWFLFDVRENRTVWPLETDGRVLKNSD